MEHKINNKKNMTQLEFIFSKEEWNREIEAAYTATASKYSVQGFRKGKAPRGVIEKTYGAEVFTEEALKTAFMREYNKILKSKPEIKPIDYPRVSGLKEDKNGNVVISAEVDVEPSFTLGKYKGFEIKAVKHEATDKDVEEYLKQHASQRVRQIAADKGHKIANGDIAVIDFVGSVDGVEFEGGTGKGFNLEIGSHSFIDNFEEQLIGHVVGDVVTVNVKFPAEYHAKNLAGKPSKFIVTVKNILVKQFPEINDQLAKESSEFETLADFKKDIRKRLDFAAADKSKRDTENELLKKIVGQTEIDVPEKMVELQLDNIMQDLEQRLSKQGMNLQLYVQYTGTTIEALRDSQRETAELSVKTRLVFDAIAKEEKVKASSEEIEVEVKRLSEASKVKPEQFTKNPAHMEWIEQNICFDKLLKFLKTNNTIKD